jgi:NAD+ kinase
MKLYFQASQAKLAQQAFHSLTNRYGQTKSAAEADVIVAMGGDGQTLHALQDGIRLKKPVFGLNFGRVGFLQNLHEAESDLLKRIKAAEAIELSPLRIEAEFLNGDIKTDFAVNEVHVCNHNRAEGIYLRVTIDGEVRLPRLGADGLLVATTVGSTGYSKSAHGAILPLGDDIIAFTPNNPFSPDRLRPTVIRPRPIIVEVIDAEFRTADVYADSHLVGETCIKTTINLDRNNRYRLLFDQGYSLHEKVMRTQFATPGMS